MTPDDSPKGLMLLLHGHAADKAPADAGDDSMPEGLEDAVADLKDALKSDDNKAIAHAFQDCVSMCQGGGGE
jgi:hypothetical protein